MRAGEKPMLGVKGRPMVSYVLGALNDSGCFERITVLVSSNTPTTARFLAERGVTVSNSSGADYVNDLSEMLQVIKPNGAFIVPADLPLLDAETVRKIAGRFEQRARPSVAVVVSRDLIERLGAGAEYCFEHGGRTVCYTGVSMIDTSKIAGHGAVEEEILLVDDPKLALNVNTAKELEIAERLLEGRPSPTGPAA
jgi:adenosylcobinamide-phosphate guanylyltransferase